TGVAGRWVRRGCRLGQEWQIVHQKLCINGSTWAAQPQLTTIGVPRAGDGGPPTGASLSPFRRFIRRRRGPGWLPPDPLAGVVQLSSSILKSKCAPTLIPPAPHRGGGTPDDRARKPHRTAPPACRRAARDQGEQGQERGCRRRGAEVVTFKDQ